MTHVDSRLWRTLLSLIARPGFLTQEYISGRQVRYLPPVQLYLVLSVAFFLLARGLGSDSIVVLDKQDVGNPELSGPARAESFCSQFNYGGPFAKQVLPKLIAGCQTSVLDGGKALRHAFLKNLPRALFLLLPVFALVMMLMYWRPRHYYVEHLLLLIHNHSAAFMVLAVIMLVSAIPGLVKMEGFLIVTAAVYFCWYLYRSLRLVFGQGRMRTLAKFTILGLVYLVVAGIVIGTTALISVATT
jgi:hypothetical protein